MNTDTRTDDELNKVIAEWCGWKWEPHASGICLRDPSGSIVNNNYAEDWRLPNYCRDLNAVHEAENKLPDSSQMRYARYLLGISTGCDENMPCGFLNGATLWVAVNATSRQRSEALVKVIESTNAAK